jgi:crotonobetaine/carnitine-CoA ligase
MGSELNSRPIPEQEGGDPLVGWSPRNMAEMLVSRARWSPDLRFGVAGQEMRFADALELARRVAQALADRDLGRGRCAMVIGTTSTSYLVSWMALQLAGVESALVNPTYPSSLLHEMAGDLRPDGVIWLGREIDQAVAPGLQHIDLSGLVDGRLVSDGRDEVLPAPEGAPPGLDADPGDIASYMHTSGTTGPPKFCAQSHEYLLRLGRFIADSMMFGPSDVVFAPLPMFHINPLGYGVVASLLVGADVLGAERFSASQFWPTVIDNEVTVAVLHLPPIAILKKSTSPADARGHRLRIVFTGDPEFLERFGISQGIAAYGSTEAGGLCHVAPWRRGDRDFPAEGMTHKAGQARYDVEWTLSGDGEILVRDRGGRALFSGYRRAGVLQSALDGQGWFHTGDLGRVDEWGRLEFIERISESIRVKGEYVPIGYVERQLQEVEGLGDFALWRRAGALTDQEVVLYVAGSAVPLEQIRGVVGRLPSFMRPVAISRVATIPRDSGVGKVRRKHLEDIPVLESWPLQ